MNTPTISFESLISDNSILTTDLISTADLFSRKAKELVSNFLTQCEKEKINPTYSYFEMWMMLKANIYYEDISPFAAIGISRTRCRNVN